MRSAVIADSLFKKLKICAKTFAESGIKIVGIDWWCVTNYICPTIDEIGIDEFQLADLAPIRRTIEGPHSPTVMSIDVEDSISPTIAKTYTCFFTRFLIMQ